MKRMLWYMAIVFLVGLRSGEASAPTKAELHVHNVSPEDLKTAPNEVSGAVILAGFMTKYARREHRFIRACSQLLSDDHELGLDALAQIGNLNQDLAGTIAQCNFSDEDIERTLENLAYDVDEGSIPAARLAFSLAGAQCKDTPRDIDQICDDNAQDNDLSVNLWQSCVNNRYRAFKGCALTELAKSPVDPVKVQDLYLSRAPAQMHEAIALARSGEEDPEETLDQIARLSQDRTLVELAPSHIMANVTFDLFALSQRAEFKDDPHLAQRSQNLTAFWVRRTDLMQGTVPSNLYVDDIPRVYAD